MNFKSFGMNLMLICLMVNRTQNKL